MSTLANRLIAQVDTTRTTINLMDKAQGKLPFSNGTSPGGLFGVFISRVLQSVMVISLLAVLIFLVWGAFEWVVSGGEKGKIEAARNKITGAVIGLIVMASSLAIYFLVQRIIGVQVFTTN
jgi:hypothetical protein